MYAHSDSVHPDFGFDCCAVDVAVLAGFVGSAGADGRTALVDDRMLYSERIRCAADRSSVRRPAMSVHNRTTVVPDLPPAAAACVILLSLPQHAKIFSVTVHGAVIHL